jgi:hypothetical protein
MLYSETIAVCSQTHTKHKGHMHSFKRYLSGSFSHRDLHALVFSFIRAAYPAHLILFDLITGIFGWELNHESLIT